MLTTLSIRDFVLIDQLNLELGMGLTTLTGETGAGKSILLDALGVCIGLRASPEMIRRGARQASITAVFDVPDRHPVFHELRELGLQIDDSELVLRRVIQADGRSRAFVNDEPTSAGTLRRLGETMVEIQGQFDLHGLLSPAHHRSVLDAFAGHGNLLSAVQRSHEALQAAEAELEAAREDLSQAQREESYLRHATEELEDLAPEVGEVARLEGRRGLLANMAGVQEAVEQAAHALYGGGGSAGNSGGGSAGGEGGDAAGEGADARLNQAYRALERAAERGGGEALQPALAAVDRAAVEVNEALAQLQAVEQALEADPAALARHAESIGYPVLLKAAMGGGGKGMRVVADPELAFYDGFGVGHAGLIQALGPKVLLASRRARAKGHEKGPRSGDVWRMPGVFAVANEHIVWSYEPEHAADHPDFASIPGLVAAARGLA